MQSLDDLAQTIIALPQADQETLITKVAQLNFKKGLSELADNYRRRLASENRLEVPPDEIWAELQRIREEVARRESSN